MCIKARKHKLQYSYKLPYILFSYSNLIPLSKVFLIYLFPFSCPQICICCSIFFYNGQEMMLSTLPFKQESKEEVKQELLL
jgi:hypothetical protein